MLIKYDLNYCPNVFYILFVVFYEKIKKLWIRGIHWKLKIIPTNTQTYKYKTSPLKHTFMIIMDHILFMHKIVTLILEISFCINCIMY